MRRHYLFVKRRTRETISSLSVNIPTCRCFRPTLPPLNAPTQRYIFIKRRKCEIVRILTRRCLRLTPPILGLSYYFASVRTSYYFYIKEE